MKRYDAFFVFHDHFSQYSYDRRSPVFNSCIRIVTKRSDVFRDFHNSDCAG